MNRKDIEKLLKELDKELCKQQLTSRVQIMIVGGAYMLTQIRNREATNDVDVVFLHIEDRQIFKQSVVSIARKQQLPVTWLNDLVDDFLTELGLPGKYVPWKRFKCLEVYVPPKEYILALKLLAGRQKDLPDIDALAKQLKIRTRKQAQQLLDRHFSRRVQQIYEVRNTLEFCFPQ
uniref:Uncharacterized protein n=1 Tax=Thermosporothrix sp. COM3 TaxID=2490863 RepID=A0A455SPA7_9CHLR|nr:hypothetical protein KTC_48480 [Thermosporothrix sp. COM3]BBH90162.1 hypothetical protein KTC_49130 [Thermosporothrix sp. COM3]BBH90227.1 hypothetical protein KTC_49780 [Thermosporothrix sp. COM3]